MVVTAHDADPIELVVFVPGLCPLVAQNAKLEKAKVKELATKLG